MATERELRRALNRVWRELEEELSSTIGAHLMVPPGKRPSVEGEWDEEYEREGQGHKLASIPEGFAAYVDGFREHVWSRYEAGQSLRLARLAAVPRNRQAAASSGKEPAYLTAFWHRYLLLAFVGERSVPLDSLLDGRLDTGGRRIDWVDLAAARAMLTRLEFMHPQTLKRDYYRARRDERACQRFFGRVQQDLLAAAKLYGTLVLNALGEQPSDDGDDIEVIRQIIGVARGRADALSPQEKEQLRRRVREAFAAVREEQLARDPLLPYSTLIAADLFYGGASGNAPEKRPLRPVTHLGPKTRQQFQSMFLEAAPESNGGY